MQVAEQTGQFSGIGQVVYANQERLARFKGMRLHNFTPMQDSLSRLPRQAGKPVLQFVVIAGDNHIPAGVVAKRHRAIPAGDDDGRAGGLGVSQHPLRFGAQVGVFLQEFFELQAQGGQGVFVRWGMFWASVRASCKAGLVPAFFWIFTASCFQPSRPSAEICLPGSNQHRTHPHRSDLAARFLHPCG